MTTVQVVSGDAPQPEQASGLTVKDAMDHIQDRAAKATIRMNKAQRLLLSQYPAMFVADMGVRSSAVKLPDRHLLQVIYNRASGRSRVEFDTDYVVHESTRPIHLIALRLSALLQIIWMLPASMHSTSPYWPLACEAFITERLMKMGMNVTSLLRNDLVDDPNVAAPPMMRNQNAIADMLEASHAEMQESAQEELKKLNDIFNATEPMPLLSFLNLAARFFPQISTSAELLALLRPHISEQGHLLNTVDEPGALPELDDMRGMAFQSLFLAELKAGLEDIVNSLPEQRPGLYEHAVHQHRWICKMMQPCDNFAVRLRSAFQSVPIGQALLKDTPRINAMRGNDVSASLWGSSSEGFGGGRAYKAMRAAFTQAKKISILEEMPDGSRRPMNLADVQRLSIDKLSSIQAAKSVYGFIGQAGADKGEGIVEILPNDVNDYTNLVKFITMRAVAGSGVTLRLSHAKPNRFGKVPRQKSVANGNLLLARDVSGSMGSALLKLSIAVGKNLLRHDIEVSDMQVDGQVQTVTRNAGKFLRDSTIAIKGRGGTDMAEIFRWLNKPENIGVKFDTIAITTDGFTPYPTKEEVRGRNVLWIIFYELGALEHAERAVNPYTEAGSALKGQRTERGVWDGDIGKVVFLPFECLDTLGSY